MSAVPTTSMVTFGPMGTPSTPIHTATPRVKLPKLVIKFDGDLTRWTTFWDAFSSSIDTNPGLCGIDKFNYLLSLLELAALEAITCLTPTEANYEEAVETLKEIWQSSSHYQSPHGGTAECVRGVIAP